MFALVLSLVLNPLEIKAVNSMFWFCSARFTIMPRISDGMVWLTTGVFSAVRAVINLLIGLILSFYILYNKELFLGQLKKLIYALCKRDSANNLINNIRFTNKTFQGFLVGKCIDSLIIGLIY